MQSRCRHRSDRDRLRCSRCGELLQSVRHGDVARLPQWAIRVLTLTTCGLGLWVAAQGGGVGDWCLGALCAAALIGGEVGR